MIPAAAAAPPVLQAPAPLEALLRRHLSPREAAGADAQALEERRLREEIAALLATQGHFDPRVDFHWNASPPRVQVAPGTQARIRQVQLQVDGPAAAPLAAALQQAWPLPAGQPFTQQAWSEAKERALEQLLEAGYAGAAITRSEARVDLATASVDLELDLASGPPHRFGPLQAEGLSRYRPELVQRYNRSVQPGAPYRPGDLLELQRSLQNSPYFSAAQVELGEAAPATGADGAVSAPVRVQLAERTPHRFGLGIGASSNTGGRLEMNGGTSDLFHQAWRLDAALRLEQLRQGAAADIFLPPDAQQRLWAFGALRENTDIQGLKTSRVALGARRSSERGALAHTLSLHWQQERRRPDDAAASTQQALALGSAWSWRSAFRSDDPEQGHAAQLQIGGASRALLSDQNFVRTYLRYQFGQRLPWGDSLILRAEYGRTFAPGRDGIPQDYLFRAGGSGSVRGYAYQSLGVREGSATVGGRQLLSGSIEYTHWWGAWGGALFIDAGDAADRRTDLDPALGYGVGLRWRSPAGPLGLDLARGERSGELRLHFALALPF